MSGQRWIVMGQIYTCPDIMTGFLEKVIMSTVMLLHVEHECASLPSTRVKVDGEGASLILPTTGTAMIHRSQLHTYIHVHVVT